MARLLTDVRIYDLHLVTTFKIKLMQGKRGPNGQRFGGFDVFCSRNANDLLSNSLHQNQASKLDDARNLFVAKPCDAWQGSCNDFWSGRANRREDRGSTQFAIL